MPDRATILAATPKCPVGPDHPYERRRANNPCGRPMVWNHEARIWFCPFHIDVSVAPRKLVHSQRTVFIETA